MGRRGPGKLPLGLKLVRGTAKKKDRERREAHPPAEGMHLPKKLLTKDALVVARILKPSLVASGLLTAADSITFSLAVSHAAVALKALRELDEKGLTTLDERGLPRKHPLAQVARDQSESFRAYSRLFGLSPSARSEIDLGPLQPLSRRERLLGTYNEWDELLDGGRK